MLRPKKLTVRQVAFIGVGSMVGAGIFALLGAAGEVAGAAVWLSFLIAGAVAMLQGYSFAKFGARYPSAAGLLEYVSRGFGDGHTTGIIAWLLFAANAIITAMVAVSFGSYAATVVSRGDSAWIKAFAVLVLLAMTILNILGSQAVARAQTIVVYVVIGILTVFAVATLTHIHPHLLAFSRYPSLRDIVSSVALTFFAFLGFGVITFAATSSGQSAPRPSTRHVPCVRYRHGHLCRSGVGRFRYAHCAEGDLIRRDGPCRRSRAGARQCRVPPDDGDCVVRHRRRHQRWALPGRGSVGGNGGGGPVPSAARAPGGGAGCGRAADNLLERRSACR